jgi:hypothetical protein
LSGWSLPGYCNFFGAGRGRGGGWALGREGLHCPSLSDINADRTTGTSVETKLSEKGSFKTREFRNIVFHQIGAFFGARIYNLLVDFSPF